jgi:hypothetical protein
MDYFHLCVFSFYFSLFVSCALLLRSLVHEHTIEIYMQNITFLDAFLFEIEQQ